MIPSTAIGSSHPLLYAFDTICSVILLVVFWLWRQRRRTRRLLEGCNLPTVTWTPRFLNYIPQQEELSNKKMKSSAITGILPRMERLGGPFGMYGTVYGISIPVLHVAHPLPAKCILMETSPAGCGKQRRRIFISSSSGASKAPAYNHFKNFSGNGVFTADGDEWKEKRASVIHCLLKGVSNSNSPAAQRLEREANYAADSVIAELEKVRQQQEGSDRDAVLIDNIVPMIQRSTIGLIYRFITHDDKPNSSDTEETRTDESDRHLISPGLKSASSSSSSLSSMATPTEAQVPDDAYVKTDCPPEICSPSLLQSYLQSVTDIRMIILAQSRSFWFLLPRWVYRTFSNMYKEEEKTMEPIRTFATRTCERAQPGSPLALLRERPSHSSNDTGVLSQDMIDEAITLLFAGQDTSAATLSWTLHLLSLYPDVQDQLAEEIRTVLLESTDHGDKGTSAKQFSKKLVSKMPLLDAVIKESMRLYPVAPFVVRKLQHEVTINDGDTESITLPEGAFACIWIYGLHRNPKLWNRPNDFVPGRWLDPSLRILDAGQEMVGAYMPFAAGPRSCVGQPLANVILRIVLARLVNRYNFTDPRLASEIDSNKLRKDMQAGFTVLPVGGLKLSVSTRHS